MIETRIFDWLTRIVGGVELCQACEAMPYDCGSVRAAFYRLKYRGLVDTVKAGGARFFFPIPDAARPTDRRTRVGKG